MNNEQVGVYGIYDTRSNELLYLGISSKLNKRKSTHFAKLRNGYHDNKVFQAWFNEQGLKPDEFLNFVILENDCDEEPDEIAYVMRGFND